MVALKGCPNIQHGTRSFERPTHATAFHTIFDKMTAGTFNHAQPDQRLFWLQPIANPLTRPTKRFDLARDQSTE
ncbi:MAG TPA: hypothetical protein PLY87_14050 [Planctomycetaceae bacterium]|nr:hypothetical protein [Planctomycetaceae bacterium]